MTLNQKWTKKYHFLAYLILKRQTYKVIKVWNFMKLELLNLSNGTKPHNRLPKLEAKSEVPK